MKKKNATNTDKKKHQSHLQVLEGGKKDSSQGAIFVEAEATNTRLMGVVGLHTHYLFGEDHVHQFFYFDAEEYGFDDYKGFATSSEKADSQEEAQVEAIKTQMFGALGGKWIDLTEEEALYLIGYYVAFNQENSIEFPDQVAEYLWLVEASQGVEEEEANGLMDKICVKLRSHYEIINYYLMRCCGQDLSAIRYLCTEEGMADVISPSSPATLFKNDITETEERHTYRAVSLVEVDDKYYNFVSIISVSKGKVTSARQISVLPISTWEASIILKKPEYVIHLENDEGKEEFHQLLDSIFPAFTQSTHSQGELYVIYSTDNSHVKKAHYRLDEDTISVVLATNSGEIIIEGQDPNSTAGTATALLVARELKGKAPYKTLGNYQFTDPIMGLFLDSDLDSFKTFLELVSGPEE